MCLRIKEKSWRCKKKKKGKYSQKLLSNVPYLYEKLLELFCTMSFIYGEVYLRSWSDTVLNFWSIFAMQLKMIFWFCIIFCCCSKIQLTGASISVRNASARVKHLVRSDMSRNTATNSVYNKCGMTFVMKRNKNWAHSWNGQTLPRGVIAIYNSYSRKASDCTWQKEKARMDDGSILLLKMSSLPMRKLMIWGKHTSTTKFHL